MSALRSGPMAPLDSATQLEALLRQIEPTDGVLHPAVVAYRPGRYG